jgi:hypothetical protein
MFKKFMKTLMVGAAVLAMAAPASAATVDINLYGASAQYLLWTDFADDFLKATTANGGAGCTAATVWQGSENTDPVKGKHGVTVGSSCSLAGGSDIIMRYSSKASYDGLCALKGSNAAYCTPSGASGTNPACADTLKERKMIDETSCTGTGAYKVCSNPDATTGTVVRKCADITLGCSDVAGSTFAQTSPKRSIPSGIDMSGYTLYNPLVVPFAFFVNADVQKCDNWPHGYTSCQGNWATITNIPRVMAVNIFSGRTQYWTDFGQDYRGTGDHRITACMRDAGSGTHATLDFAVMRGNGWGRTLWTTNSSTGPYIVWNDGSSNMMTCLATSGAIGYADADQSETASIKRLKYQGEDASRISIRNGRYVFWSRQYIYEDANEPSYNLKHPVVAALMAFANNPDNIPGSGTQPVTGKALYWASDTEMRYMKGNDNSDKKYVNLDVDNGPEYPEVP